MVARAPLAALVSVAGRRWNIEESFQTAKTALGLDQHQNRRWTSWHRWTTLAILAHAFLAAVTARRTQPSPSGLIPLTVNELHRLFNALVIEPSRRHADQLKWSIWRRRHQARAKASHYARQALTEPVTTISGWSTSCSGPFPRVAGTVASAPIPGAARVRRANLRNGLFPRYPPSTIPEGDTATYASSGAGRRRRTNEGPEEAAVPQAYPQPPAPAIRRPWLRIFLGGLALWLATVVVTFLTGNPNLLPTLVLLGSFLVPVTFVAWAFQRRETGELTPGLILNTFLAGGVLGVLAASLLESYLLRPSWWLFFGVGLIEEAVKLAVLAFLTRHLHVKAPRDGIVLGASVGFGFAALETAGYAFTALFTAHGLSVPQVVETELLRGVIAPFGHGLWTAILGGVLFSSSTREHFTITGRLILAYLGVSLLHALWDGMRVIALLLTLLLTGGTTTPQGWLARPTAGQVALFAVLELAGLALVALVGVVWLWTLARSAHRAPQAPPPAYGWRVPIRPPGT